MQTNRLFNRNIIGLFLLYTFLNFDCFSQNNAVGCEDYAFLVEINNGPVINFEKNDTIFNYRFVKARRDGWDSVWYEKIMSTRGGYKKEIIGTIPLATRNLEFPQKEYIEIMLITWINSKENSVEINGIQFSVSFFDDRIIIIPIKKQ